MTKQFQHQVHDPNFGVALADYLKQFEFKVTVKLGPSHSTTFNEFHDWCHQRLGTKYKDWFLYTIGKGEYCVFVRESKWASFLALTHVDKII